MNQILHEQLQHLFLKMTLGSARKKIYALRAKQEGQTELADLFSAISSSEAAQAARILVQLRGQTGSNEQNRAQAFEHEIPATIEACEKTAQLAGDCQDKAMHGACSQSARVQRIHLSLQKKMEWRNTQGQDHPISYHVCRFCGFIMEDKAPDICPICTAPAGRFQKVTA
jgi:rubrerythrin